jgi:hypothetical protein
MEQSLRSKAQHVVLTILTDGLPSNERGICNDEQNELFRKSLKTLEKLPIQVIIRLNTDHGGIKKVSGLVPKQADGVCVDYVRRLY